MSHDDDDDDDDDDDVGWGGVGSISISVSRGCLSVTVCERREQGVTERVGEQSERRRWYPAPARPQAPRPHVRQISTMFRTRYMT
jgi:hypothetical protein